MRAADWTYELPRGGEDSDGIEGYNVEAADGELLGVVATVVERAGRRYVVVQHGSPVRRELEAVPLDEVVEVDHTGLAIRLRRGAEAAALALDPSRGVEGGDCDARRVLETGPPVPAGAPPVVEPTPSVAGYVACFAAGAIALLALVVVAMARHLGVWGILFAVPVALFVAGGTLLYRFVRYRR